MSWLTRLLNMVPPVYGSDLQQFLCSLHWFRRGISYLFRPVELIQVFSEKVYDTANKRPKHVVERIRQSDFGWDKAKLNAFKLCETALAHQATMCHRDDRQRLCFFTNASGTFWSGVAIKILNEESRSPM